MDHIFRAEYNPYYQQVTNPLYEDCDTCTVNNSTSACATPTNTLTRTLTPTPTPTKDVITVVASSCCDGYPNEQLNVQTSLKGKW